jgi:hypothetical protein
MHRSKLASLVINCKTDDPRSAAESRTAAPDGDVRLSQDAEAGPFVRLDDPDLNRHVEVRSVPHPGQVHPDIESDTIEAEVARLATLQRSASSRCLPGGR